MEGRPRIGLDRPSWTQRVWEGSREGSDTDGSFYALEGREAQGSGAAMAVEEELRGVVCEGEVIR